MNDTANKDQKPCCQAKGPWTYGTDLQGYPVRRNAEGVWQYETVFSRWRCYLPGPECNAGRGCPGAKHENDRWPNDQ